MTKRKTTREAGSLDRVYHIWGWALLAWSLYRYFLRLPEWADELVFKPIVFVAPVLWYVATREKKSFASLGLTTKNLFPSIYTGLAFGFLFALEGLVANTVKYGKLQINPIAAFEQYGLFLLLVLAAGAAFSEELLSRGFLFTRIFAKTKNLLYASLVSTVLFVILHIPILVTMQKLQGSTLVLFLVTDFVLGFANSLLFFTTGSLVTPILVHIFWNMTVALYL